MISAILFAGTFLAGCVLAFSRHPVYGFVTYIAVFFLNPISRWWGQDLLGDVRWALIAAGVTLLALLARGSTTRKPVVPFMSHSLVWAYILFVIWLLLQSLWALESNEHRELLSYYVKFLLVLFLFYRCVDSDKHLQWALWTHVAGCFYFGWIAYTTYEGGRFEGFGGPGTGEANAGALVIVTGILAAAGLFLFGSLRQKVALFVMIPVILNALVTTVSRSGFLALVAGGLIFNWYAPKLHARKIRALSALALALFLALAGPTYWQRMQSIEHVGADIEGLDTGGGRLEIMAAQWNMFLDHPFGCGAVCTAALSPLYMDSKFLADDGTGGGSRVRASHNTFMTMLVEHGIPGAVFYVFILMWVYSAIRRLGRNLESETEFRQSILPAIAAVLAAITVGDMFVTHAKLEVRVWFLSALMVLLNLSLLDKRGPGLSPGNPSANRRLPGQAEGKT